MSANQSLRKYTPSKAASGKRVGVLFYLLTGYILLQFIWWAYLLIDLNKTLYSPLGADAVRNRVWMIVGEGSVFLIFLLAGIYIMQRTIRKELDLIKRQRNFLLSITHELKTPVAAIKLSLQTLLKREGLHSQLQNQLQTVAAENTERLQTLIDNVLLATQLESNSQIVTLEKLNASEIASGTVQRLLLTFGKANIATDIANNCHIRSDRSAFESILLNLLENAIKYGNGSSILVKLAPHEQMALLEVVDGGPGIPDSEKPFVFQKFYRMGNEETRSRKGTGLGLYIVWHLTEMLGAKLTLSDNPGGGTRFTVEFPI